MKTNYVSLPFGKISKEGLIPWFEWLKDKKVEFKSFPELNSFFKEITNISEDKIETYQETSHVEMKDVFKEKIIFCLSIVLFDLGDSNVILFVRFLCDDTVSFDEIYFEGEFEGTSLEENIKNIDRIIYEKQKNKKLSWKEFTELYTEIISGIYSKELTLPSFYGL